MNGDIINTIILFDNGRYYKRDIWIYADGTYTLGDDCGDHEEIDENDVLYYTHEDKSDEYVQYVAETGDDYLNIFIVNETRTIKPSFYVWCKSWVGQKTIGQRVESIIVKGTIFDGKYEPSECPKEIAEYLELKETTKGNFVLNGITDDFINESDDITVNANPCLDGSGRFILEHVGDMDIDRDPAEIKKEIISLAKKDLENKKKGLTVA